MGDLGLDKLFVFMLLALPGVIAIRVYGLWSPSIVKDWKDSVVDFVTFSFFNLFLWGLFRPGSVHGFIVSLKPTPPATSLPLADTLEVLQEYRFGLFLYAIVSPTILASVWHYLRRNVLPRLLGTDHPVRTAWDWAFLRGGPYYLLIFMKKDKDGKQTVLGGYFGGKSYVSSYPCDADVFCERQHYLTQDNMFGDPVPDGEGLLVKFSECERIEFGKDNGHEPKPTIVERFRIECDRLNVPQRWIDFKKEVTWLSNPSAPTEVSNPSDMDGRGRQ